MTSKELMDYVREVEMPLTIQGEIKQLKNPSGRSPFPRRIEKSNFYNSLSDEQKITLEKIVFDSVKAGIFQVLVMIDNLGSFLDKDGEFELFFAKGNERIKLNDPPENELHDLFNSFDPKDYQT